MEPTNAPLKSPSQKMTGRAKLGLWLLIGPSALWVAVFILYAVVNVAFSAVEPSSGELFAETSTVETIVNVLLFLAGVVAFLTWLPGLITGIILLATKPQPQNPTA